MKLSSITPKIIIAAALLLLSSCEVEFSPNADWKEIPVVYCLLDQDDDTTWARVERCYLGEGSIYSYSSNTDSINYPMGSLDVYLVGIDGDGKEYYYQFRDTTINRQSGNFANTNQHTYYLPSQKLLKDNWKYDFRVYRHTDRTLIAHNKQPISLIIQNSDENVFTKPTLSVIPGGTVVGKFAFKDKNNTCIIEWPALQNARLYQPFVRFYYAVDENNDSEYETHEYIDIRTPSMSYINGADRYTIYYQASGFLTSVKEQLKNNPYPKKSLNQVDLYLTACSEDFSAYMSNIADAGNLDQSRELYSNIEGGRGVFAARRTKLYRSLPADDSVLPTPPGLVYQLKQLQIGF